MDIAFNDLVGKCIIIYMDDLTMFSKTMENHLYDLSKVLKKCISYGLSLNPKKCVFGVSEGKILGHIISECRISIDLERVQSILKLTMPGSKKEMRSFFGKINFIRKFIIGFAEIVKPLNEMMKKESRIEWSNEAKAAFTQIKQSITEAPMLTSPDYLMPFYIYSFASEHSCVAVLTQRKDAGDEHPIAFMSSPFKNAEIRYPPLEKQVFALV
jgi:hypothetical protein